MLKTEFAVKMTCSQCSEKVRGSLKGLNIESCHLDVPSQTVVLESKEPPSRLLTAIRSSGLITALRGIASPFTAKATPYTYPAAAVCIFESFKGAAQGWAQDVNRGLARLVQIGENEIFVDLSVDNLEPNSAYSFRVNECGDLSQGAESTGDCFRRIGQIFTDSLGKGEFMGEVKGLSIWQIVGRSLVLEPMFGPRSDSIAGIVARSGGLFENKKTVCACSGKTLWEEASRL